MQKVKLQLIELLKDSVVAGLALAVVAVVIIAAGAVSGGTVGFVLASIGVPLLTVAIVNFVFEPFAKEAIASDVRTLLSLHDSIARSGLLAIDEARTLSARDLLAGSTVIRVVPRDPQRWLDQEFLGIRDEACARAIQVHVLLPDPDSASLTALAGQLGVDHGQLAQGLTELPDRLGESWDQVSVHPGSVLVVQYYEGIPAHGIACLEQRVTIECGPAVRREHFENGGTMLVFEADSGVGQSIDAQIVELCRRGTVAGVRPLTYPRDGPAGMVEVPESVVGRFWGAIGGK